MFNLSLATGIYVDEWKCARVSAVPIYKSEDKSKCENYQPISILPIISKVTEREAFHQAYQYLSENSLLSSFLDFNLDVGLSFLDFNLDFGLSNQHCHH